MPPGREGFTNGSDHPLSEVTRRPRPAVFPPDCEPVPAEPGHRVGRLHQVPQSLAQPHQHLVAHGVAECVIDLLEAIDVKQEDRPAAVSAPPKPLLDPVYKRARVARPVSGSCRA